MKKVNKEFLTELLVKELTALANAARRLAEMEIEARTFPYTDEGTKEYLAKMAKFRAGVRAGERLAQTAGAIGLIKKKKKKKKKKKS